MAEGFGARVRRLRLARGLTLKEMAAVAERTEGWMSRLEAGAFRRQPDYHVMVAWAGMLGVTPEELAAGAPADAADAPELVEALLARIGAWPFDDGATIELEQVASAGPGRYVADGEDHDAARRPRRKRERRLFAVQLEGDCLLPEARAGDLVVFDLDQPAMPDDLVVAVDGEAVVVKYLKLDQAVQYLMPLNGEPIRVGPGVRIVGVVDHIKRRPARAPKLRR